MNEAAVIALGVIAFSELAVIVFLAWLLHIDNGQVIAMTDRMARRVQAPQLAAIEAANEEGPLYAPPALIPDDDEAYWESREQLADRLASEEVGGGDG